MQPLSQVEHRSLRLLPWEARWLNLANVDTLTRRWPTQRNTTTQPAVGEKSSLFELRGFREQQQQQRGSQERFTMDLEMGNSWSIKVSHWKPFKTPLIFNCSDWLRQCSVVRYSIAVHIIIIISTFYFSESPQKTLYKNKVKIHQTKICNEKILQNVYNISKALYSSTEWMRFKLGFEWWRVSAVSDVSNGVSWEWVPVGGGCSNREGPPPPPSRLSLALEVH